MAKKNLNDLCPYIYECKEPWCFKKFGDYYSCRRYIQRDPRLSSKDPLLVDGWREETERFK